METTHPLSAPTATDPQPVREPSPGPDRPANTVESASLETPANRNAPQQENMLALLEAIVAFIDEGVVVAQMDGRVLYHNPAAGELLGLPGNQPLQSIRDVLGIRANKSIDNAIQTAAEGKAGSTRLSGRNIASGNGAGARAGFICFHKRLEVNEDLRELEFYCCKTPESLGRMRLMIIRDVTERHRLEMLVDRSRGDLVTNDRKLLGLLERVHQVAPSNASVLLQGESGTGKTHIARLIHRLSRRSDKPFVEVNCAAIPTTLMESEFFGHVKGAFTGATRDRSGRFGAAHGGTLFLDEIAEVPLHLQAKLLRAIQDKQFEPVGSDKTQRVDIRIITASNKSLREMVEMEDFRADLFYRLAVFTLQVPPIRERPGDIPLLLKHFCQHLEQRGYPSGVTCSPDAMQLLMNYDWPGNVRELENAVEHALICAVGKTVLPESLPEQIRAGSRQRFSHASGPRCQVIKDGGEFEANDDVTARLEIEKALALAEGNKSRAAKYLGIDRTTLWRRMQRLHIVPPGA